MPLLSQDQLQDMMLKEWGFNDLVYHYATEFSNDGWGTPEWANDGNFELRYNTMEQLWLAYVMYEKFNKIWDGNNWLIQSKENLKCL